MTTPKPLPPVPEQVVATMIGGLTAGPMGALSAWWLFRFLGGKWGPWTLAGLFVAPAQIVIQAVLFSAVMVATVTPSGPGSLPPAEQSR